MGFRAIGPLPVCLALREAAGTSGLGKSQETGRQGLRVEAFHLIPVSNLEPRKTGRGRPGPASPPRAGKADGGLGLENGAKHKFRSRDSQEIEFSRASPDGHPRGLTWLPRGLGPFGLEMYPV